MDYYISRIPNKDGYYEIHQKKCFKYHMVAHHLYLGYFDDPEKALEQAQKHFNNVVFCPICLRHYNKNKEPVYEAPKELFEDFLLNNSTDKKTR